MDSTHSVLSIITRKQEERGAILHIAHLDIEEKEIIGRILTVVCGYTPTVQAIRFLAEAWSQVPGLWARPL